MTQEIMETYLNDGVLMVFTPPVDEAFKRDAMDSSLYVQLAASKQFDRFTHYHEWQTTLIKALATFGWVRLDLTDNQGMDGETFSVTDMLRKLLPEPLRNLRGEKLDKLFAWLFTAEASDVAKTMVKRRVRTSAGAPAANPPEYVSSVVLQVAFLLPSRQKVLLCVAFETQETLDPNLLAQRLLKSQLVGEVRSFGFVGMLDDLRYSLYRERVDTALTDKRTSLCSPVKGLSL
ncbi:hypothetical protein ACIQAL_17495 [Pseudomonas sp. NPDC088368]|jgi:hypothetical protein|uniref:hypothetical protein n=1 Tax=Pseudomonas sp. NPDC088368 TaxID=3364453 RepID=UPI00381AF161